MIGQKHGPCFKILEVDQNVHFNQMFFLIFGKHFKFTNILAKNKGCYTYNSLRMVGILNLLIGVTSFSF